MRLNTLKPSAGAKRTRKRVGRGIGSTWGKTCGKGHKGQKSRGKGKVALGFEGGQMPLIRRVPKYGFTSWKQKYTHQLHVSDLEKLSESEITLDVLKQASMVKNYIKFVKVIAGGELSKAVTLKGIGASKGALAAIEAAGGKVEE